MGCLTGWREEGTPWHGGIRDRRTVRWRPAGDRATLLTVVTGCGGGADGHTAERDDNPGHRGVAPPDGVPPPAAGEGVRVAMG
jgi:hypothetical protein